MTATAFGLVFFLAIASSPQYDGVGAKIANGLAGAVVFGGTVFVIGYGITKMITRRRQTKSTECSTNGHVSPLSPPSPKTRPRATDHDGREYFLTLDQLDRTVRAAAIGHWPHGNYVSAVDDTARAVNAAIQGKTGLHRLSESDLINHLYSDKPPKSGDVRLRFPGDRASKTWMSRTNGARSLGIACFAGIRNVAAHERRPRWSRDDAFEYLVMFSVLMRWLNECEVERNP